MLRLATQSRFSAQTASCANVGHTLSNPSSADFARKRWSQWRFTTAGFEAVKFVVKLEAAIVDVPLRQAILDARAQKLLARLIECLVVGPRKRYLGRRKIEHARLIVRELEADADLVLRPVFPPARDPQPQVCRDAEGFEGLVQHLAPLVAVDKADAVFALHIARQGGVERQRGGVELGKMLVLCAHFSQKGKEKDSNCGFFHGKFQLNRVLAGEGKMIFDKVVLNDGRSGNLACSTFFMGDVKLPYNKIFTPVNYGKSMTYLEIESPRGQCH